MLVGGAISWKSSKQTLIASLTMAAEFIACFEASNHGIWLRNFVTDLCVVDGIEGPLKICCDHNSAVLYSNNNRSATKSKFIDIKFLVVKERVQNRPPLDLGTSLLEDVRSCSFPRLVSYALMLVVYGFYFFVCLF